MNEIKKQFFMYRNGAVADTLRRYGLPHKVIFGLDVPRIAEIARGIGPSFELAMKLWEDSDVRESRLLAAYLFPVDRIDKSLAIDLALSTRTQEEADMLAFRVLAKLPCAPIILSDLERIRPADQDMSLAAARTAQVLRRHLET